MKKGDIILILRKKNTSVIASEARQSHRINILFHFFIMRLPSLFRAKRRNPTPPRNDKERFISKYFKKGQALFIVIASEAWQSHRKEFIQSNELSGFGEKRKSR